jgi:hypothetical protein
MNLEEHLDAPDPISQTVLHLHRHHLLHHLRVHQVDQADLHQIVRNQIDRLHLLRVLQAEVEVQVVIEIEVIDQIAVIGRVEAEVPDLEKMNNVMIAELN